MDLYDKAIRCFTSGLLKEASAHFKIFLENKNPQNDFEQVYSAYESLITILEQQNLYSQSLSYLQGFLDYIIERERLVKSIPVIKKLLNYHARDFPFPNKGQTFKKVIFCLEKVGHREKAIEVSTLALAYYSKRKNMRDGPTLAEEQALKYEENIELKVWNLKFALFQNHNETVDAKVRELLAALVKSPQKLKKGLLLTTPIYLQIQEIIFHQYSDEGHSVLLRELILRNILELLEKFTGSCEEVIPPSWSAKILNLLIESLLLDYLQLPIYFMAAKYYFLTQNFQVSLKYIEFIESKKRSKDSNNSKAYKDFSRIEKEVLNLKDEISRATNKKDNKEEKDHGTEVQEKIKFSNKSNVDTEKLSTQIELILNIKTSKTYKKIEIDTSDLEKNIRVLFNQRKFAEVEVFLTELESVKGRETFIQFYKTRLEGVRQEGFGQQTIVSNLLQEISQYCENFENDNLGMTEHLNFLKSEELLYFKKSYEAFYKTESIENIGPIYKDLVTAFNFLSMNEVSLIILNRMENEVLKLDKLNVSSLFESENLPEKLNDVLTHQYLKVTTLVGNGQLVDALSIVEWTNHVVPLNKEEALCFFYIQAELNKQLGNKQKALRIFKKIEKLDSSYRLTRERINELKKS